MQDGETGAAGQAFGYSMAAHVIASMGLKRTSDKSNEVLWGNRRAVVKSCGRKTNSLGVTVGTLDRIDSVIAAFVTASAIEIWELSRDDFVRGMVDSRSRKANGRVKQVTKGHVRKHGRFDRQIPLPVKMSA